MFSLFLAPAAEAQTYGIDRTHTSVGFKVKHLVVNTVRGNFGKFDGSVTLDEKNLKNSKLSAEIDAASIDTGTEKRDDHLRSADFFDVSNHPTITFTSSTFKKTKGGYEVVGKLTMHGVTKPILLEVKDISPEVKGPRGEMHRAFVATGTINRKDFGLNWSKTVEGTGAVVSDEVQLVLEVALVRPADGNG